MRLILMGPPGSGKGTQATAVADRFGVPAISTGDIFRHHIKNDTEIGRQVKAITASGGYVPDTLTNQIVEGRLREPDATDGFLLDGYPRTVGQVEFLDTLMAAHGHRIGGVLELVVDESVLVERLLKRAAEQGRADDTEAVIRERMAIYRAETEPLTDLYAQHGVLIRVDGMGSVEQVAARLAAAVEGVQD
ncbi:MAG: adenylate kinase [Dermatophilaceae bacterium]